MQQPNAHKHWLVSASIVGGSRNPQVGHCLNYQPKKFDPPCSLPDCRVTRLCPLVEVSVGSCSAPKHLSSGCSKLGDVASRGPKKHASSPVRAWSTMQGSAWQPEDRNQPRLGTIDSMSATCRSCRKPRINCTCSSPSWICCYLRHSPVYDVDAKALQPKTHKRRCVSDHIAVSMRGAFERRVATSPRWPLHKPIFCPPCPPCSVLCLTAESHGFVH